MPRLAYNAPPEGYDLSGNKKWTDKMYARLGVVTKGLIRNNNDPRCNLTDEIVVEKLKAEIEKILKDFGYPEEHGPYIP